MTLSTVNEKSFQRRKLLFFVTEDWYFVSHRLVLAVAAKKIGYDVAVVTRVRNHHDAILSAGIKLIPLEVSRSSLNPLGDFVLLVRLTALLRRERPDICHHVAMKPVLYGSIAARLAGVPCVINALAGMGWLFTSSSGIARLLRPIVRWGLGRLLQSGITVVQNPEDLRVLTSLGVPQSAIRRIPGSGVDLQLFAARPEPAGMPIVLLPARLLWDKGVGEFVQAARLLRQRGVTARFVLAGEPDFENPSSVSRKQLAEWLEEGVVECVGWVDDMPSRLSESHVVCLPSYREGLPKSLVEAAAAGRPIVTSDTPGCRDVVRHGENGLLVPIRDAVALADALALLIRDSSLRQSMGLRGRERAEREFGLRAVIDQTLAIYEEVCAGGSTVGANHIEHH